MSVTEPSWTTQCLDFLSSLEKDLCQALSAALRSSSARNRSDLRKSITIESGSPLQVRCHRRGMKLLKEDAEFRRDWTGSIGLGLDIPSEETPAGPNGPKIEAKVVSEMVACA